MQNQKLHYAELIKEIIILTVAVAIIAAAVFPGAEPYVGKQHFGSGHCAVQLYSAAAVSHHNDSEHGALDHRVSNLRKRVWRKDCLYEYPAAIIHRAV